MIYSVIALRWWAQFRNTFPRTSNTPLKKKKRKEEVRSYLIGGLYLILISKDSKVPHKVFKRTAAQITGTLSQIKQDIAASLTVHTININQLKTLYLEKKFCISCGLWNTLPKTYEFSNYLHLN